MLPAIRQLLPSLLQRLPTGLLRRPLEKHVSTDYELDMGGKGTFSTATSVSSGGINGCTAIFFFGSAATRTAAHLTVMSERQEALLAALQAAQYGNAARVVIRSRNETTAASVKAVIETVMLNAQFDVKTYPFRDSGADCWEFTVARSSETVVEHRFQWED